MKHYLEFPTWIRPEIITGLPFQWYGLFYVIVIVVIYMLFMYQLKQREKLNFSKMKDTSEELFIWLILAGLIGSRIFYALFDAPGDEFFAKPWRVLWPFEGKRFVGFQGMNYYGGVVGVIIAFSVYTRIRKIDGLMIMDLLLAVFPLGFAIERLGAFINGELFGRVSTMPWAVVFPAAQKFPASESWVKETASKIGMPGGDSLVNLPRHPTQFYEMIFVGIALWLVLWFVVRKARKNDGFVTAIYLIASGALQFVIGYFRVPGGEDFALRLSAQYNPPYLFRTVLNLSQNQIFSLFMLLGGILLLLSVSKKTAQKSDLQR